MKIMFKHSLLVLTLFACIISCKNETSINLEGLTLNNNEKWIVNNETHIGMSNIDSILKNNTNTNGKSLGDALSKETSYIIKSCDMTGEAHDQLHVVLVPILEEVIELKEIDKISESENELLKLKQLVAVYFRHFKL